MRYQQIDSEKWEYVDGFGENYVVSSKGVIRSLKRKCPSKDGKFRIVPEKEISKWKNFRGYELVSLHRDGRKISIPVHRIVAQAFIQNKEKKGEVNHKDGDKSNNNLENLEWCTRIENQHHSINVLGKHHAGEKHYNCKLSVDIVEKMRALFNTGLYTKTDVGKMFGVKKDHAINIINHKCWKTLKKV